MAGVDRAKVRRFEAVLLGVLFLLFLVLAVNNKMDWNTYLNEHHCHEVGHKYSRWTRETIYSCDGGQIIVRGEEHVVSRRSSAVDLMVAGCLELAGNAAHHWPLEFLVKD